MDRKDNLVIGIGNLLLCDDALGPLVVRRLAREEGPLRGHCDFLENYSCGLDLLDDWEDYRRVIIIDSFPAPGQLVGTCLEFPLEELAGRAAVDPVGTHGLNLPVLWQLAGKLGRRLPAQCLVIGIVVRNTSRFSEELSAPLQEVFEEVVGRIRDKLECFTALGAV